MCYGLPSWLSRHHGHTNSIRLLCSCEQSPRHLDSNQADLQNWRRGGDSNTQFLSESHFQCDALPFCTPLLETFGRGGSRTPMRLSPPFVSSEDLYHLGELFHQDCGGRRICTARRFPATVFKTAPILFWHSSIKDGGRAAT